MMRLNTIFKLAFCVLVLQLTPTNSFAGDCDQCPDNPTSVEQLKKCKLCKFKLKQETWFENFYKKGKTMPLCWQQDGTDDCKEAKGKINTGGMGSSGLTALTQPGSMPKASSGVPGGGGPGGADSGGGPGGPGGSDSGDGSDGGQQCAPPFTANGGCIMFGEREEFESSTQTYQCGAAAEMSSDHTIFTSQANVALVAKQGDPNLYAYLISGKDLSYRTTSPIPDFYCTLQPKLDAAGNPVVDPITGEPVLIAPKTPVTILNQYLSINNNVAVAPIAIQESSEYIVMDRKSGMRFEAKPPNPSYFTSAGAENVDPQCRTLDNLVDPMPVNFGDISFQNGSQTCSLEYEFPGAQDPENCEKFVQFLNGGHTNIYVGPGGSLSVGRVSGGGSFATNTVQSQAGDFVTTAPGEITYTGTVAKIYGGFPIYLGTAVTSINEQAFLDGATFVLSESYTVHIEPPGRIKLGSNGVMQLIDGGTIQDRDGNIIRVISPMGSVQFPSGQLVEGTSLGDIVIGANQLMVTAEDGSVQLPVDAENCPTQP